MKTLLVDAVDAFVIETPEGFKIFEDLHSLLEVFPNPKILLTGANDEQFEEWNLNSMPYPVFTLKHNPEKTDPLYYKTMLEQYNLKPTDVVYFEHNPKAVESAQSAGIKTFFYDADTKDLLALKQFLEENLN